MATSESYWAYARECEHWARKVADETDRRVFFEMANAWKELAMREKLRAAMPTGGAFGLTEQASAGDHPPPPKTFLANGEDGFTQRTFRE
jgi:hypothetical protein